MRLANARQVLGGTAQRGDTDLTPREEDRAHIWQGCLKMAPSLAAAKVGFLSTQKRPALISGLLMSWHKLEMSTSLVADIPNGLMIPRHQDIRTSSLPGILTEHVSER